MQKERVMLRAAGGIPYELTRGRVKRLNPVSYTHLTLPTT